ncbi:hypothetical protein D3C76_957010 [compost metagenome]
MPPKTLLKPIQNCPDRDQLSRIGQTFQRFITDKSQIGHIIPQSRQTIAQMLQLLASPGGDLPLSSQQGGFGQFFLDPESLEAMQLLL